MTVVPRIPSSNGTSLDTLGPIVGTTKPSVILRYTMRPLSTHSAWDQFEYEVQTPTVTSASIREQLDSIKIESEATLDTIKKRVLLATTQYEVSQPHPLNDMVGWYKAVAEYAGDLRGKLESVGVGLTCVEPSNEDTAIILVFGKYLEKFVPTSMLRDTKDEWEEAVRQRQEPSTEQEEAEFRANETGLNTCGGEDHALAEYRRRTSAL